MFDRPARRAPRKSAGALLFAALVVALLAVISPLVWPWFYRPTTIERGAAAEMFTLVAFGLGSAGALAIATASAVGLWSGRVRRSPQVLLLMGAATLTALPGLYLGEEFLMSLLPPTAAEMRAIALAEHFIERNGYTSKGHPKDLPVLQNDILDPLRGSPEEVAEMRRGTLQPHAVAVSGAGIGFLVFFEQNPPSRHGLLRAVQIYDETAEMVHQDMYPGLLSKRTRR